MLPNQSPRYKVSLVLDEKFAHLPEALAVVNLYIIPLIQLPVPRTGRVAFFCFEPCVLPLVIWGRFFF